MFLEGCHFALPLVFLRCPEFAVILSRNRKKQKPVGSKTDKNTLPEDDMLTTGSVLFERNVKTDHRKNNQVSLGK